MASDTNIEMAVRLLDEIRIHNNEMGGTFSSLCGSKGCGKTTWMHRYAGQVCYIHPKTKSLHKETVVWRGRDIDYWTWWLDPTYEWEDPVLKREVVLHFHDKDKVEMRDELKQAIVPPTIKTYKAAPTLYKNLVAGAINVVYEPRDYRMSPAVREILTARSCSLSINPNIKFDPTLFWFEFVAFLLQAKGAGFLTMIWDEADEIFPQNPVGLRWHIQEWFKDNAKDLRKNNVSFIFSCHDWNDIDYRIGSKVQYKLWMKGARLPPNSIIKAMDNRSTQRLLFLPIGQGIIERDGYGNFNVDKIKERPRVKVQFTNRTGLNYDRWTPDIPPGEAAWELDVA